jgi:uncharacterized protein (DUF1501 family)
MSRIHFQKRRDFLKGATCLAASGAASAFVPQLSLLGTALAGTVTGYKALVCLYLDGGSDSFNMLIPVDNTTSVPVSGRAPLSGFSATPYGWYATSRGGLYQGIPTALGIPLPGTPGGGGTLPGALPLNGVQPGQYGLNPAIPELQTLYNAGRLAFVANAGPLVFPMRRSNFNSTARPPNLYSHNDQTSLWQIGAGDTASDPMGWGGKMAGVLLGASPGSGLAPCISIAGSTRYLTGEYPAGQTISPYRLSTSGTNPATSLGNYNPGDPAGSKRREVLTGLLNETYPQAFSNEYGEILDRSMNLSITINAAIANLTAAGTPYTAFNNAVNLIPNTGIGSQLRQVARMIAVSRAGQGTIQANRQVFFVRTGGYDTHDGQIPAATANAGVWAGHQGLLQQIAQAMSRFYDAMTALNGVSGYTGVVNEVVTHTMSEFSRTINSNGNGTDHAWGQVAMVMGASAGTGGPLNGGQVYGRYPLQLLNRTYPGGIDPLGECFNRGEFLPTTATEQMSASLARWMGMSNTELPSVFPNIDNFVNAHPNSAVMAYNNRVIPNMMNGII